MVLKKLFYNHGKIYLKDFIERLTYIVKVKGQLFFFFFEKKGQVLLR